MWGLFGFSHSSNAFTYGRDISCHSAIQSFYVQLRHFVSLNHRKFLCTVETFCVISQLSKVWTYSWDVLCDFSTIQSFSYSWDSLCNFSTTETFYVQIRHFVWFFNHSKICRTVEKFMYGHDIFCGFSVIQSRFSTIVDILCGFWTLVCCFCFYLEFPQKINRNRKACCYVVR